MLQLINYTPVYQPSVTSPCAHCLHVSPCAYLLWNDHIANQNLFSLIEKKTVLHERNVIKEILWMMCGVKRFICGSL
ncbi:hypothetical protein CEXT_22241 [Caerostris extrusa]|uniref:Uncharacterized protein n=1 Tax=Caerostris extrusa TaxID=172846 RepID=A0AAV4QN88_CAEEX|nr:hypothetical protein CEXT_22241 [Caerostris extrusa]